MADTSALAPALPSAPASSALASAPASTPNDVQRLRELERRVAVLEGLLDAQTCACCRGRKDRQRVARRGIVEAIMASFTWRAAAKALGNGLFKLLVNFATFVYFTRLHQFLMHLSYKYYIQLLMRRL